MGSIQFLGLASGTDWNNVIQQLVAIERRPVDNLIKQRDKLEFDRTVMNQVSDRLRTFSNSLSTMRFESTFLSRKVEASNSSRVNATAEAGAPKGTYNVEISRLAQASRASSGLDGAIFSKVVNLSPSQTMGIASSNPYGQFQPTRALASTLIKDTLQAGQLGAAITKGDTIAISGNIKDGTAVSGTFTFAGDETDTLERLATAISQVFHGEIAGSVGTNGELTFIETSPGVAGDVTFNTTVPPLGLQFNDTDYSGSTLAFGIGNQVAGGAATARRLVNATTYTSGGAVVLSDATDLASLDQVTSGVLNNGDVIRITGREADGSSIAPVDFTYTGAAGGQTIADLVNTISGAFGTANATYENGKIVLTGTATGGSNLDIGLDFVDAAPATAFVPGSFFVGEPGRTAQAQMVTTGSFTVEGMGEHLLSSSDGKAGMVRGTVTLLDPSNTLSSYAVTEFSLFSIDADGTGGLGPVTITGLNAYSTLQDLVDAINEQVPSVTAQLAFNGTDYRLEIAANTGGREIRIYDAAGGILDRIVKIGATDLDSTSNDLSNTFAATTDTTDATIIDTFRPDNGGPVQRRIWTGDEGAAVTSLLDGVALIGAGGAFNPGVATLVTANSSELNTQQDMYAYIFGSNQIAQDPPQHLPALDPALALAEAGFALTPENSSTNPLFHTNGFFTINGVQINVGDVNTTTVNQVLGAINASGAGVTAYFDEANLRFYLRNNSPGGQAITLGGNGDTSNFLAIAGLLAVNGGVEVQGQSRGNIGTTLPLSQGGFTQGVTSGVMTINGTRITIDAGVDSLGDVIRKINNSGAGVTASYDPIADRFTLAQKLDGSVTAARIQIGDPADTSNFLEAVQLTADTTVPTQIGSVRQTARFRVNGISYERAGNEVSDVIEKVKLSLNATTTGPETITISSDSERTKTALIEFIAEYNKTMELINARPLSKTERDKTAELTNEQANKMTTQEIEDYLTTRNDLLTRQFLAGDNSVRQITRRVQDLVTGLVRNDGEYQSLSQIGISTSAVGGGPSAVSYSQGRLLTAASDKETIKQFVESDSDLIDAIENNGDELYKLFANMLESRANVQGTVDLGSGIALADGLRFSISDGTSTAEVSFGSGPHSKTNVLNTINSALVSAGMSGSVMAYLDAWNQLNLRAARTDSQAYLQLLDNSPGSDSLFTTLGLTPGISFGPDPSIAGGVALRARQYVTSLTDVGGLIMERIKENGSFDRIIGTYNDQISRMEDDITAYEQRLRDKFARLETNLASLQTQSKALDQALAQQAAQQSSGSNS